MSDKLEKLEEKYWKYHNKAEKIKARIERLGGTITHPLLKDLNLPGTSKPIPDG